MKVENAAEILAQTYLKAPEGEKLAHIHLFGIIYADQIDGMSLQELTERAGIYSSYKTEIRKGIKLARYVQLKP